MSHVTVADVVRHYSDALREDRGGWLPYPVERALRDMGRCRTAALGGHLYACESCASEVPLYNSCQNRHCPQCQSRAKERWLEARMEEPTGNFPHALSEAAGVAARVGLYKESVNLLQEALDVGRDLEPRLEGFLLLLRAMYRAEHGELDQAEAVAREADRWFQSAGSEVEPMRRFSHQVWTAMAWLSGDLEKALARSADPATARLVQLRAQVLFDAGQLEESRYLLGDLTARGSQAVEAQVLSGRLALTLNGDFERCLTRVEPALAAEESWSRGPTWYLAEARSAMTACLRARGRHGDEARAFELEESAREMLRSIFAQETPLHRRIPDIP